MPEDRSPSRPTPPRSAQPARPPVPRSPDGGPTGSPQSAEQPARKVDLTVNKVIAGAGAEVTAPMPRIPPAGTAQVDQPTELLRPADPATAGLGSSDAPTAEVGS